MRAEPRNWLDIAKTIEALEDVSLDANLVAGLQAYFEESLTRHRDPITFYTPSFKKYCSSEIGACNPNAWPAVSITGPKCSLQCDHCQAKVLEPMIPATTPSDLWALANSLVEQGAQGMLLTGGSTHRNEVEYGPFLPVVRRIKDALPNFRIACHTALMNAEAVFDMEQAGVDVAMLDVIGAQDTVTQVYHLRRAVDDFERTLESLASSSMQVVPHIVIGLHYGKLFGEWRALEMIARHAVDALVLVVAMPYYAPAKRAFESPNPHAVGRFFHTARQALPNTPLLLGCARPAGQDKLIMDSYAVMAGLDGIAYPGEGMLELAAKLRKTVTLGANCCAVGVAEQVFSGLNATDGNGISSPPAAVSVRIKANVPVLSP